MSMMQPLAGESAPFKLQDPTPLQSVELELTVGRHGMRAYPRKLGPVILGVSDAEYTSLDNTVAGLEPARGDVFAAEGVRQKPGQPAGPEYSEPHRDVLYLLGLASESPYIKPSLYPGSYSEVRKGPSDSLVSTDHILYGAGKASILVRHQILPQILEDAGRLRIIDPLRYARLQAELRGMPSPAVDAYSLRASDLGFANSGQRQRPTDVKVANGYTRNMEIVEGLNVLAAQVIGQLPAGAERPRLVYGVGAAHREPLTRILNENQVSYTVSEFSEPCGETGLARATGLFAGARNRLVSRAIVSQWKDDWEANAEAFRKYRAANPHEVIQ